MAEREAGRHHEGGKNPVDLEHPVGVVLQRWVTPKGRQNEGAPDDNLTDKTAFEPFNHAF